MTNVDQGGFPPPRAVRPGRWTSLDQVGLVGGNARRVDSGIGLTTTATRGRTIAPTRRYENTRTSRRGGTVWNDDENGSKNSFLTHLNLSLLALIAAAVVVILFAVLAWHAGPRDPVATRTIERGKGL